MGAPIPLPNIQLRVFKPDVSKYHANKIARIRAIGERARQDRIRKESYQRALGKEFLDVNIDKYKFTTEYYQGEQAKKIDEFNSWSAGKQAQEGKVFSESEIIAARRYAGQIDNEIEQMSMSEKSYKKDGEFIVKNMGDVDIDFYNAHTQYDPRKDGMYQSYLRKKETKPSLRELNGAEITSEMNTKFFKNNRLDERHQTYLNKHGDKVEKIDKFIAEAYILNDAGVAVKPNTKWQFQETSDLLETDTKWQIGIMGEYEKLGDDKKKFYENLAMKKDMSSYEGFYNTDFTDVNDETEVGDVKDAYKYYYYDKHGDDNYAMNKNIKTYDAAIEAEKKKQKARGGFAVRNGKLVIGSTEPTTVTYKTGDTSGNYYQLGASAKRSQTGNLVGVVDISGEGTDVQETLNASDYESYDLIGFDFDSGNTPMAHVRVSFKNSPVYQGGKPVYKGVAGYSGTIDEITEAVNSSNMKDKKKKQKIADIKEIIANDESGKLIKKSTRRKDMLMPVNRNPGATNNFVIDKNLLKVPEKVDYSQIDVTGFDGEDLKAAEWLKANPTDPQAESVYKELMKGR